MKGPYDDIIHLPHPVSKKHRQMPIADRAAQFMPFAALTGYEAALAETARLTSPRIEPDDAQRELLNRQLCFLQSLAAEADSAGAYPESRVSCVVSDSDMQAASAKVPPNAQGAFAFSKNTRTASSRVSEPARSSQEEQLSITVTYFCPDTKKEGGVYHTVSGQFLKVDVTAQQLYLQIDDMLQSVLPYEQADSKVPARLVIPLADILGLGKEGHINTPGTIGSPNWEWHLPDFIQAKKELQKFGRLIVDTKR